MSVTDQFPWTFSWDSFILSFHKHLLRSHYVLGIVQLAGYKIKESIIPTLTKLTVFYEKPMGKSMAAGLCYKCFDRRVPRHKVLQEHVQQAGNRESAPEVTVF